VDAPAAAHAKVFRTASIIPRVTQGDPTPRASSATAPMSATTIMSALVKRVIMPNRTLLPTPLPANSPMR
jgi:hypothetical protein